MIVGLPKEIKENENRVGLTPAGVIALRQAGHKVIAQKNAGVGSGFEDSEYHKAGAEIVDSIDAVYKRSEMIVKVKEPIEREYPLLRKGLVLFTYLHLAANKKLTSRLMESGVSAIGYETVETEEGYLPLLAPMSDVAGRMAVQIGCNCLEKHNGGRGVLLSGVPGVPPADVVIVGGGIVGISAARLAIGAGAQVTVLDICTTRLKYINDLLSNQVITIKSNPISIARSVQYADLLIGAVLITGAKAPKLVTREMVKTMKKGSVIVDVAIDQGGCVETSKVTSHNNPTFIYNGVVHYCVGNMPGSVPRTSTLALTNETLPYVLEIAQKGFSAAVNENAALRKGVNFHNGCCVCHGVADAFNLKCHENDIMY
ncbi:MAG: Alanine dehydrogenase 2 [bacterium ADurb.Bin236]|nr:MAG: Alanine dehydrogenase 2 [bacterium ADurb.Bin236]